MRSRWPYAFPWGRLAMSQAGAPTAGWAAIGGPPLLSFLVALTGAMLAWLVLVRAAARMLSPGRDRRRLILAVAATAATAGVALAGTLLPVDGASPGQRTVTVAAVQGDVPHARSLPGLLRASTVTENHAAATRALAAQVASGARPAPDLVIWPENSTDLDPGEYPAIYATIARAVAAIDRPVLVGALLENPLRNTGQLWLPRRGPVAIYVKRQLVPFGEYIPFRSLLAHITPLVNLQPVNFTAGHRAVVFHQGPIRLGDVICYEIGFDGLVRSEVSAGANLLAVQSNDATFEVDGQSGESTQQVAMARIQAITSGPRDRVRLHDRRERHHRPGRRGARPHRDVAAGGAGPSGPAAHRPHPRRPAGGLAGGRAHHAGHPGSRLGHRPHDGPGPARRRRPAPRNTGITDGPGRSWPARMDRQWESWQSGAPSPSLSGTRHWGQARCRSWPSPSSTWNSSAGAGWCPGSSSCAPRRRPGRPRCAAGGWEPASSWPRCTG